MSAFIKIIIITIFSCNVLSAQYENCKDFTMTSRNSSTIIINCGGTNSIALNGIEEINRFFNEIVALSSEIETQISENYGLLSYNRGKLIYLLSIVNQIDQAIKIISSGLNENEKVDINELWEYINRGDYLSACNKYNFKISTDYNALLLGQLACQLQDLDSAIGRLRQKGYKLKALYLVSQMIEKGGKYTNGNKVHDLNREIQSEILVSLHGMVREFDKINGANRPGLPNVKSEYYLKYFDQLNSTLSISPDNLDKWDGEVLKDILLNGPLFTHERPVVVESIYRYVFLLRYDFSKISRKRSLSIDRSDLKNILNILLKFASDYQKPKIRDLLVNM
jgi:hypothetical protein